MYNLVYDRKFQKESGYSQQCDLIFYDFLDALKHARNVVLMVYPSATKVRLSGSLDDYGNFKLVVKTNAAPVVRHQYQTSVATIYHN